MIGMFDVGMCWSIFLRKLKLVLFSHHPAPMLQAQRFSGQLCTSASESLRSFSLPFCSLVSRFSEHIGQLMNWKLPNHDQILLLWMIQEQDLCFSKHWKLTKRGRGWSIKKFTYCFCWSICVTRKDVVRKKHWSSSCVALISATLCY